MFTPRLASIPQIYRNVIRWREVLGVLSKYGLADWLSRLDIELGRGLLKGATGTGLVDLTHEQRIRLALTELGPTGIKLGQVLSTRPDVVGIGLATELEQLQSATPATPFPAIHAILEQELGRPPEEVFVELAEEPLASASLGQVHVARLAFDGEEMVVKVQHPDVRRQVEIDLEILSGLANLADGVPELRNYQPSAIVAELERTLERELDYRKEESSLVQFRELLANNPCVHIPEPRRDLTTERILTMERLVGIKLSEREALQETGLDLEAIARRGADLYLEMIFEHGVYHADPHPGNILLLDDEVIGLIDFGMIGHLDEPLQDDIESMLMAVIEGDGVLITSIIARVGRVPESLDRAALGVEVSDFVAHYSRLPLDSFDLTGALQEMTELIRRYQIVLPARLAMLIKTLIVLEGSARRLAPGFNLLEVVQSFHRRSILRRLSPRRQLRRLRRLQSELQQLLEVAPRAVVEITEQIRSGRFEIHLQHRGLEPSVNRLVLGLLASALFLGSSLLVAQEVPPLFHGYSLLGSAGTVVSLFLALRLILAINRSGHLNRSDDRDRP
jgi:ubiquinone biosynthesis protein